MVERLLPHTVSPRDSLRLAQAEPPPFQKKPDNPKEKEPTTVRQFDIRFGEGGTGNKGRIQFFSPEPAPDLYKTKWNGSGTEIDLGKIPPFLPFPPPSPSQQNAEVEMALKEALKALNQGQFKKCHHLAKLISKKNPENEGALFLSAMSDISLQLRERAKTHLDELLKATSQDNYLYLFVSGYLEMVEGDYPEAIVRFKEMVEKYPDNFDGYRFLAFNHLFNKQTDLAQEVLNHAHPTGTNEKASLAIIKFLAGDRKKGEKELEEVIADNPKNPDMLGAYSFMLYVNNQDKTEALEYAEEALKLKPHERQAESTKAVALWDKGLTKENVKEAIPLLQSFYGYSSHTAVIAESEKTSISFDASTSLKASLGIGEPDSLVMLSAALYLDDRFEESLPLLTKAVEKQIWTRQNFVSQERLVDWLSKTEMQLQKPGAREHCKQAFDLDPSNLTALANFIELSVLAGNSDILKESKPYLDKLEEAYRNDPAAAKYSSSIGFYYLAAQQPEKALDYLKKAEALRPDYFLNHERLALAYAAMKRFEEAENEAQQAVYLKDPNLAPYQMLVLIPLDHGEWEEAENRAETLFEKAPNQGLFAKWVGGLYTQLFYKQLLEHGFAPIPPETDLWRERAEKWLQRGMDLKSLTTDWEQMAWFMIRLLNNSATMEDMNKAGVNKAFFGTILQAQKGNLEEADSLFVRYKTSLMRPDSEFSIDMLYPLVKSGHIDFAQKLFRAFWDHRNDLKNPKEMQAEIESMTDLILSNPYPPEVGPLIATMAIRIGDEYYKHSTSDFKEAMEWYNKALKADPSQEGGSVGLKNCYQAMHQPEKAQEIIKRFSQ